MKPSAWIQAFRRGEVEHAWAEITVEANGHAARFRVSAQPLKAAGVTRSIGARGLQRLADVVLDDRGRPSLLLTDKLADERCRQATVRIDPLVGDVAHTTDEQSSDWMAWALANGPRARAGQWLVAGGWKVFILHRRCSASESVNRGYYADAPANVDVHPRGAFTARFPAIQGRPGANGIPCYPTTVPGLYAVQVVGRTLHGVARTDQDLDGLDQDDYSQKGELLGGTCWVRRAGAEEWLETPTAELLVDPELCALAVGDGQPLPFTRLPGVPVLTLDDDPPDTEPSRPPSNQPPVSAGGAGGRGSASTPPVGPPATSPLEPGELLGVDLSAFQPPHLVDWRALHAAGNRFAIGRAAYGTSPDHTFVEHVRGARAAGLQVGGYGFYRQRQPWRSQLETLLAQYEAAELGAGDIVPAVDLEWNQANDGPVDAAAHNAGGRALVEAIAARWGACLVYIAPGFWLELGKPSWVLEHPIWVANYGVPKPVWPAAWAIWQWSPRYKVGPVVLDANRARRLPVCR